MITEEMIDHYVARTKKHIDCVVRNIEHLVQKHPELEELLERSDKHDLSKWDDPEYTPYIYLTWRYKSEDDDVELILPDGMEEEIHEATWHHVKINPHHPEHWDDEATNDSINKEDRDKPPDESIHAHTMDLISLAEMVCDWHAMGLERDNTAESWADKNVGIRWLFDDDQVELMYQYMEDLEDQTDF